ncbi:MAG TPA: GNAT family N-acetyltransferase [Oleiagrimonas sp.]|nr:GNAT family N-acetyltransferase [Oleiagrimonas sp.]
MPSIAIHYASLDDLDVLATLFNDYRVFYRQDPDLAGARHFLHERMRLRESVILLASDADSGEALGFVQLYPGFSSVAAMRIWILNDLFVSANARRRGVARALLQGARDHARATGVSRLILETNTDNQAAQTLYESEGWEREDNLHYRLPVRCASS